MFDFQYLKEFKNRKIRPSKIVEGLEPQEIFLDSLARKKEEELGISQKKLEIPLSKKILQGFWFGFLIIFIVFFAKSFWFQIIEGKNFSALAKENIARTHLIQSERGVIYDRNGRQLAFNKPSFDLVCDKRDLPLSKQRKEKVLQEISKIIQKDFTEISLKIASSPWPQVLVSENLDHETLILLETRNKEFPGFKIKKNTVRNYIQGQSFSHLIGYTAKINPEELAEFSDYSSTEYIGRAALEKFYEATLRGEPGTLEVEKDALGKKIGVKVKKEPEPGKSLVLWLDASLQKKIEEELEKSLERVGAKKAAAVALDPKTGGVSALVSLPNFDNNLFSQGMSQEEWEALNKNPFNPLYNRGIAGTYPIGSIIKPLIATATLEEKIITPQKQIDCQGMISVPNPWDSEIIYEFRDWKRHGWTDLRKAIAESCNVYFYIIGGGYRGFKGLGVENIKRYLELFGLGKKTGIDLPQEKEGLIPDPVWKEKVKGEIWYPGDTYHLSIGQGDILATPLQVAVAFSAIANGGKLLKPKLVQKIIGPADQVKEIRPEIIRENFIDPENLQIVKEGMREAVTYGSSVLLNSLPVKVAAKTGTAERGTSGYYNWVTVFGPYDDPQIVLTIIIEEVKDFQLATLPVAKEVLEWYFGQPQN